MIVLTHPNPELLIRGFGGPAGARYDAQIAREALFNAMADLKQTRSIGGPDYAFWRRVGLVRVRRLRDAVRRAETEVMER